MQYLYEMKMGQVVSNKNKRYVVIDVDRCDGDDYYTVIYIIEETEFLQLLGKKNIKYSDFKTYDSYGINEEDEYKLEDKLYGVKTQRVWSFRSHYKST